jgi:hypothetical protein
LLSYLKSKNKFYYTEKSVSKSYPGNNNDSYREIDIKETDNKEQKTGIIYNLKHQEEKVDFNFYFLELRLSRSIDKTITKEQFSNGKKSNKPFERNRVRFIFKIENNIELHLTIVMTEDEKKIKTYTYEAEFEIPEIIPDFTKVIVVLNQYLNAMSGIDFLPKPDEIKNVISQYNNLIENRNSNRAYRNELIDIKLSDIENMKNSNVSNKLDGSQYYLLIIENTIYLFNPLQITKPVLDPNSLKIYRIVNTKIPSDLSHTLMAGEYRLQYL